MFLSSITLYDVIWGTAVPVCLCLIVCLIVVSCRILRYLEKHKQNTICGLIGYVVRGCWLPQDLPPIVVVKEDDENQQKNDTPEKDQAKAVDENENRKETPLEIVTTST